MVRMEQTMRWFGPADTFSLEGIRQAGCTGVVTALHHIPYGEIWTIDEIKKRKSIIEAAGLSWSVIESLPVHEDIKKQTGNWKTYIENYKESLRNIAACGLKVVTYNFMPVLDWVRTDVAYRLPSGSLALRFEKSAFAAFDLFVLKRPAARNEYSDAATQAAEAWMSNNTQESKDTLTKNILLGLPGSDEAFTLPQLQRLLKDYEGIDASVLKAHLFHFLREVAPVTEELGLQLAIHPDDPPFSVLGLPRVVCTEQDVQELLDAAPLPANGLCFCTGSFGARGDNDIPAMLEKFGDRVHFLHLRNTKRDKAGNFHEAEHLAGDTDMVAVVKGVLKLMQRSGNAIPMRPDHGHQMLDDLNKKSYPGYSGIGRLKGLAELRGLELGLLAGMHS